MPAFAVECKGYNSSMAKAQLQCAYNGALITEGVCTIHVYIGKSDNGFYSKTQALIVVYNSDTMQFYGHYTIRIPISLQPTSGGVDSSVDANSDALVYHQYILSSNNPRDLFENF
jgi:hypothetical protein